MVEIYDLVPCSRCKAQPGQPCDMKQKDRQYHCPRQDRASRERMKLTVAVFDHTDAIAMDYAATQGITDDSWLDATGYLRAEIERQARDFMRNGKMVPPTLEVVRQLLPDPLVAKAFKLGVTDRFELPRSMIDNGCKTLAELA